MAAPCPSAARLASRRTPSISAWARSCTPTRAGGPVEHPAQRGPGGWQQQPMGGDLGEPQLAGVGERVVGVGHDDEVLGEQRLDDQLRVVDGQVDDRRAEPVR